ncbi:MAG: hypothetical protein CMK59_05660 [Proteobacteria bacterium]|nr:hypothetical protein [Pseudomonadota bacterium]
MTNLDLFRKKTLTDLAKILDITPFDLARHYGTKEGLPVDLLFEKSDLERLKKELQLEDWWAPDGPYSDVLSDNTLRDVSMVRTRLRQVSTMLLQRQGEICRSDNLLRGFAEGTSELSAQEEKSLITVLLNLLIRSGAIQSISMSSGLGLVVKEGSLLQVIAQGKWPAMILDRIKDLEQN